MLPSKLLDNAVNQFSRLPGVGRKTALRLVLHMLRQDDEFMDELEALDEALDKGYADMRICGYADRPNKT